MPLRPTKDEKDKNDQAGFMRRCMHELAQSETKRPQDQKIAICLSAWREGPEKKTVSAKDWSSLR